MTFLVFFYRWRGSVSFNKPLYIRFTDQLKPSEIMNSSTENFDPQKFKLLRGCLFTPEWYSNIVIYCITYVILRYKKRLKMALNFATNFRETLILVSKFLIYRRNFIWLKNAVSVNSQGLPHRINCSVHLFYSRTHKMEPSK